MDTVTYRGGCHCGRVRFEVDAPAELYIDECNCSMCTRTAFLHLIVTGDRFRITQGREALTMYTFNTGTAKHYFCGHCGIKPFYVPRSHPDGWSVNARCIDEGTVTGMRINPIDGRNWEQQYPEGRGRFIA